MPANISVPMVQVLSQNLGLAGFVALGREEDDRNTGFLLEWPRLFTEDARKVLLQQSRTKQGSFLFGSASLFLVSALPGRTLFYIFHSMTMHHCLLL